MQKCIEHPSLVIYKKVWHSSSFYTNPNLPSTNAYKFSSGLKQQFPPKVCTIDSTKYRTEDLTTLKDDYYPIVITIEAVYPPNYQGRARKCM